MAKQDLGSTSLSVQGGRAYVNLLRALAAKRGITLAELTRHALDKAYGQEVDDLAIFFAKDVACKQQSLPANNEGQSS